MNDKSDDNDNLIGDANRNRANPLINPSYASHNYLGIVEEFKKNSFVNEDELLTRMYTLHTSDNFAFYIWSDEVSVNRMIICVHRGSDGSEVVFCKLIYGEDSKDNHNVFVTENKNLLNEFERWRRSKNVRSA